LRGGLLVFRVTIRELFLLTVIAGLSVALFVERRQDRPILQERDELKWRFDTLAQILAEHEMTVEVKPDGILVCQGQIDERWGWGHYQMRFPTIISCEFK
jgi:hypothetical protein